MMDSTHLFVLHPDGDGTRLEQVAQAFPKGLARLMAPVLGMMVRRIVRDHTERLVAYLAGRAAESLRASPLQAYTWIRVTDTDMRAAHLRCR